MANREVNRESIAAWIGIDWADEQHAVCLRESGSKQYEASTVKQTPEALQDWVNGLRKRFEGRLVAVALEQSRGPLVCALMGCDFMVLYPINPKSSARYREALYGSGAKNDPADAELLVRFLEAHQELLRAWYPQDPQTRKLQMLFAAQSICWSKWAAAYYHKRIQKGQRRQAVLRSLAYRWKRIIFRCWKDGRPYDEERYLQVLEKRKSPLVQQIKVVKVTPGWNSCAQIMTSPEVEARIRLRKNTD